MKLWWHKLTHWEYWPAYIIYMPTFFLWIGCMIRFRSIRFYAKSNPAFKNGGLYDDGKKSIYDLLPADLYPKTVLISTNADCDFQNILTQNNFSFPLIVKPDVGLRGIGVNKVNDIESLITYREYIKKDFLIQENCDYPNEIGLFYCRFPNQKNGTITGITIKQFLKITGDGIHTIHDLMLLNPRHAMQIHKLQSQVNLAEILPLGVEKNLVPFGNHNRGTEFIDGQEFITSELIKTFDAILNKIEGFYYGRLDIRYQNFKDLEGGKNFKIIEINGAKSEPTHIYDPKHSLKYALKEIYRHQKIFCTIVAESYKL